MLEKRGWLVNDCLTTIPNTKTFWHDLLGWMPGLVDQTGGYTDYRHLADAIEKKAEEDGVPDYIIRNATFFRRLNIPAKTVCLLQDYYPKEKHQLPVCNSSDVVVFNSPFTHSLYRDRVTSRTEIVPLGTDFDHFSPGEDSSDELGILPNSVLFVGAANDYPKGFDVVKELIDTTSFNICLVMKDDFQISHPRVRVFNRVSRDLIHKVYNSCKIMLCTSRMETQHLSGIEAAACGLPVVATNVGVYFGKEHGEWGRKATGAASFAKEIRYVLNNYDSFRPREHFLSLGYDQTSCKNHWADIVSGLFTG